MTTLTMRMIKGHFVVSGPLRVATAFPVGKNAPHIFLRLIRAVRQHPLQSKALAGDADRAPDLASTPAAYSAAVAWSGHHLLKLRVFRRIGFFACYDNPRTR
jgi:hypothetical protein